MIGLTPNLPKNEILKFKELQTLPKNSQEFSQCEKISLSTLQKAAQIALSKNKELVPAATPLKALKPGQNIFKKELQLIFWFSKKDMILKTLNN